MSDITHEISLDRFHEQISYVLNSYSNHGYTTQTINNVVIGGLGGSGIGGRIAKLAFFTVSPVPVEVYSEYSLPAYAGENTLVILCSYSGNTEETLAMYAEARKRGCKIICLASGGKLHDQSLADGYRFYTVEQGYQPRMALGYSLSTLLMILGELTGTDMRSRLQSVMESLKNNAGIKEKALTMFDYFRETVHNKFVIICDLAFEGVAIRCCQQIQENAKGEAFISLLPEANHNMIESYYGAHDTNFLVLDSKLNHRTTARFQFVRNELASHSNRIYEYPVSEFNLNTLFEVIHATDWLSIWMSDAKGVNNMQVGIIMRLKAYLDEI
ncbi:MAG: SIS domain-containing protein [Bacteroidetes bacterium]|nr:SIS domain-containing protein [Bacteroidota bacterium]